MNLPETWVSARIGNICALNPKLAANERPEPTALVSFVPMSAVDEDRAEITALEVKPYVEVMRGYTPFRSGDVLFAKITPSMENGKAAIARILEGNVGLGSTEFHVLRPNKHLLPEYLLYFIRQKQFRRRAAAAFVGSAGQQRVPEDFLSRIKVPLPTIPEQQRIVQVLRQAEQQRDIHDQAHSLEKRIYAAFFYETFGNPALNPMKWPMEPFGKHVSYTRYGPRFPDAVYTEEGAHILRTTDMEPGGTIRWWESPRLALSEKEIKDYGLKPRTLLVSRSGTIGPVAVFDGAEAPCIAGAYLLEFGIRETLEPEYVRALFQSEYVQALMTKAVRSVAQPNLNAPSVKAIRIPIPSINLQRKFAAQVAEFLRLKAVRQDASKRLAELQCELTVAAFTGELSEEWRRKHRTELERADTERRAALGKSAKRLSVKIAEYVPAERPVDLDRPARGWLVEQLSEFQRNVLLAMRGWKSSVVLDDTEGFADFCSNAGTAWPIEHEGASPDRIKRTLEQLAALGFIAKVQIPNENGKYMTAFRPLREGEDTRLADASRLEALLRQETEQS